MVKAAEDLASTRIKQGLCPENGESLEGKDIRDRAERLWPQRTLDKQFLVNAEAKRRKKLLLDYADKLEAKE